VTGWLIDSDVLSAFAPGKPPLPAGTSAWFEERTHALFLPAIAVVEIEAGIAKLRRTGSRRRAEELRSWFDRILVLYFDRVLPLDLDAARLAGIMSDSAQGEGRHPGFADVAVAAIAQSRQLTVLTVNLRHFRPLGVEALNPLAVD
jgi:predicted nucleic acid-binding protein